MKSNQSGFTLVELMLVIWFLVAFVLTSALGYVAWHFISKVW